LQSKTEQLSHHVALTGRLCGGAQLAALASLDVDPSSRATASDALESEWIQGLDDDALIEHELRGSLAGIIQTRASFQGIVRQVQWINKSKKMCSSLTMDSDDLDEIANSLSESDQ